MTMISPRPLPSADRLERKATSSMPREVRLALYRSMLKIRRVEERIKALYPEGDMRCPTHFSIGQEAVAAGGAGTCARKTTSSARTARMRITSARAAACGPCSRNCMAKWTGARRARAARCTSSTCRSTSSVASRLSGAPSQSASVRPSARCCRIARRHGHFLRRCGDRDRGFPREREFRGGSSTPRALRLREQSLFGEYAACRAPAADPHHC